MQSAKILVVLLVTVALLVPQVSSTPWSPQDQGDSAPTPTCPSQKSGTVTDLTVTAWGLTQADAEWNLQWGGGYDDELFRDSGLVCGNCTPTVKCEWWVDVSITFTPMGSNRIMYGWIAHGKVTGTYVAHCGNC